MIEIALNLIEIYAFAFATGWGLYRLIVPPFLTKRLLYPLLVPGLGLAQLALVAGYCIDLSRPIVLSLTATSLFGLLTFSIAIAVCRPSPPLLHVLRRAARAVSRKRVALSLLAAFIFCATLCAILSPVLRAGMATTPYRIGIDQVGYAESAQYLMRGETLDGLRAHLLAELRTTSLSLAERQNYKDIDYETYVDSEFLLKASRWGFPGTLAALTILTGNVHVYKLEFILLIFGYALSLGIVFYLARNAMRLPSSYAFLIMLALAFNCNMLNVYFEGQYAQIFAGGYFLILLAIYLRMRAASRVSRIDRTTLAKTIGTFAMLAATLFSAFNESLVLFVAVVIVSTVYDLLFYRRTNVAALVAIVCGFVGGVALAWPFSHGWIAYSIANLSGLSRAGFWQPHWASLSEILGFSDMYVTPGYKLLSRGQWNTIYNVGVSIFAACIIARLFLRKRDLDVSFWLAPFTLLVAEYAKSRYVDDILNYPYMKLYTMFIPLFSVIAFTALYHLALRSGALIRFVRYAAPALVIVVGLFYTQRYVKESRTVTSEMLALYRSAADRRFDKFAIITNHSDIEQYMYVPLMSMRWLDEVASQKYLAAVIDMPVLMVVRQADVPCRRCVASYFAGKVAYEDATELFINTGLTIGEVCDPSVRNERIATLGYDSQKVWIDSSRRADGAYLYRQCDFGFAAKLLARATRTDY